MEPIRIVFSNATPNDQGGIITNDVIEFKRFKKNPVVLCQHDWNAPPLGKMTDIKIIDGKLTGIPVFHRLTPESMVYADLYEAGFIKACSIGGEAEWKTNAAGQVDLKNGFRQCTRFNLYEVSIVTLPSNPDAVTMDELGARCYDKKELGTISNAILTLSSKFKISSMKKTAAFLKLEALQTALAAAKGQAEPDNGIITSLQADVDAAQTAVNAEQAALSAGGVKPTDPSMSQMPGFMKEILGTFSHFAVDIAKALNGGNKTTNSAPALPVGQNSNTTTNEVPNTPQPNPTGLTAKQQAAKEKAEAARQKAQKANEECAAAKEKADKEGSSEEDKAAYNSAYEASEKMCKEASEADDELASCMSAGGTSTNAAGGASTTTQAQPKPIVTPVLKTVEQLNADRVKLAPKPVANPAGAAVLKHRGTRFTDLSSTKNEEGQRILNRVMTKDSGEKSVEDYRIVLESIMHDGKYSALTDRLRVIENVGSTAEQLQAYRDKNPLAKNRVGKTVKDIMQQLESGQIEVFNGSSNRMETRTLLTSTDNALAAPALNTIEWLSLAIFELFPSMSWKDDISMFPADMVTKNTGLIWANITAQPPVARGTQPVNPSDYQADDAAQSLTLIPYFMGPMVWNPINLHQLRYDKMTLQWAQAFSYWGSIMDDELLYILATAAAATGNILYSSGYAATPSFTLNPATPSPDQFYFNNQYNGALATPAYNDIAALEQVFNNQNFDLGREKMRLVTDPTAMKYIKQDPLTQSLLTRWLQTNDADLLKISHTGLNMRSRVAALDLATSQIKDPTGIMPATTVSAMLFFLASQVAIAIAMLDVFFQQAPSSWGFRMSADMRIGAQTARLNGNGTGLFSYGQPKI